MFKSLKYKATHRPPNRSHISHTATAVNAHAYSAAITKMTARKGGAMLKARLRRRASVPKMLTIGLSNTILQQTAQRAFA